MPVLLVEKRNFQSPNKDLSIFHFDLNSRHIPPTIGTNFRSPFDLFRAMRTGFAAGAYQVFREKEKGHEDRQDHDENEQNHYYLAHSNPHNFTSCQTGICSS